MLRHIQLEIVIVSFGKLVSMRRWRYLLRLRIVELKVITVCDT